VSFINSFRKFVNISQPAEYFSYQTFVPFPVLKIGTIVEKLANIGACN
jgi:hypothetical protein